MSWPSEGLLGLRAGPPQGLQVGAMIHLCTIWGQEKLGFSRCNKGRTPGQGRLAYREWFMDVGGGPGVGVAAAPREGEPRRVP